MLDIRLSSAGRAGCAMAVAIASVFCIPHRAAAQTQFFGYQNMASSTTVTFAPTSVNRIINTPLYSNIVSTDYFSTYNDGTLKQASLVATSSATFITGIAQSGFSNYTITSATLSVGGGYSNSGGQAFQVLTPYNSSTVTWNNWPQVSGSSYASTAISTGAVSGGATRYSIDPSVVTAWINGTGTANNGLYFPVGSSPAASTYTLAGNVSWSLTLQNANPVNTGVDVAGTVDRLFTFTGTAAAATLQATTGGSVRYLVVGGGGAGGSAGGGGGGAGGFLTDTNLSITTAGATITVGAGGAGVTSGAGNSGSNSVLAVTGTTITAIGGGGGGPRTGNGLAGGSGGGGGTSMSAGSGTSPQGFSGGVGDQTQRSGGGGGAGGQGSNSGSGFGGTGGPGATSDITGVTGTYAAGGGGSSLNLVGGAGPLGNGGSGGGGSGGQNNGGGSAGSSYGSGGGGQGGQGGSLPSGNGASGVVMLRFAAPYYYWDTGTAGGLIGGDGEWNSAKWTLDPTGAAGITSGSFANNLRAAVFNSSGTSDVTVTGSQAAAGLFVNQGFVRFSDGGSGQINLGSGTASITGGQANFNANLTATGGIVISSGATLGGDGTITGLTTFNGGTHSPGNSPGVQTFASGITYAAPTSVKWELVGNTTVNSPVVFDQIVVSGGTLAFSAVTTLNLSFDAFGSGVDWDNAFWSSSRSGTSGWLLYAVTGPGAVSNFSNLTLATGSWKDSGGSSLADVKGAAAGFSLYQDVTSGDIYIAYAVPEPGSLALLAVGGGAAFVAYRRGRRRQAAGRGVE